MSNFPNHDLESELDPNNPDFVDNFNKIVEEAYQRWKDKVKLNPNYPNDEDNAEVVESKKKKKKALENIFKDPPPFKPANFYGGEFEKLKILKHGKEPTNWDIARVHLIERSYFKENKNTKDIRYTNANGREFGEKLVQLSDVGRNIIDKFVLDNQNREKSAKRWEDEIDKYKHSKPPVICNPWKYTHQIGDYFSSPKADKVHMFSKPLKEKLANPRPFLRTKVEGDYFNKIDLSCEYDKYKVKS